MLWNYIYEFYISHVFGGYLNQNEIVTTYFNGYDNSLYSVNFQLFGANISVANYLSLICTVITIVAILLFCVFIIKKIIAIIFRLFTGSSAF